ncbi:MFS transporter [Bordetella petrii]|uniref:MFS transporter n=1 Tax=Bordetella petrii TaxID=94624 RepID=UPI001E657F5E|nr:MFS transporter [Bordetella petrii]MCD0501604.1 MFS transporter [Bordetella petrii]
MTQAGTTAHQTPFNLPALFSVLLGVAVITLDISLTSTAVPAIAQGIGSTAASTIWIINIYYLAVIAALLPLAALGEIYGHRRVFLAGLAVFALGSLASGLASSLPTLMAGRGLLGLGSAAISATTPALIKHLYPAAKLGRGLGLYAMIVGIAFALGPTAASAILSAVEWRWLFLLNAPVALLAVVLAFKRLPPTERNVRSFDAVSALLCAGMFACLLYGIAGMAHLGWRHVIPAFIAAAACAYWLRRRESGLAAPILAVDLFRIRLFTLSSATAVCAFAIQGLVFVVLPFLFQFKLGYSQVEAGFLITPWPVTLAIMTLVAAPLSERITPGVLGGLGLLIVAAGLVSLATIPDAAGPFDIAWRLVLCGVGFGFFQSPNMVAMMSSAPRDRSGGAGGILAASRLLGQSVGAAAVAFCLSAWPEEGIEAAIWFGTILAVVGSSISLSRVLPFARRP